MVVTTTGWQTDRQTNRLLYPCACAQDKRNTSSCTLCTYMYACHPHIIYNNIRACFSESGYRDGGLPYPQSWLFPGTLKQWPSNFLQTSDTVKYKIVTVSEDMTYRMSTCVDEYVSELHGTLGCFCLWIPNTCNYCTSEVILHVGSMDFSWYCLCMSLPYLPQFTSHICTCLLSLTSAHSTIRNPLSVWRLNCIKTKLMHALLHQQL